MTIDLTKLKTLATAAATNQYDAVALNDFGTALPPATVLGLIAEIERHRLINAEGCKPDSNILLSDLPCAGAASCRSLDKAEGCKPDLNNPPFQREDRYIVIKRSDLKKVPVNYRSSLVEPMFSLLPHLPRRECLVIEGDWPEFEPTWAAIEARVTGKPAEQRHSEPAWYMTENGLSATHAKTKALSDREGWDTSDYSIPLYTHAAPAEVDDIMSATSLEFGDRLAALEKERDTLRAHLTGLKRRHDGLHRDMYTIAAREVPKGCSIADYAAAAIAEALPTDAEPINDLCAEGAHEFIPFQDDCMKCSEPYQAAPAPKAIAAILMQAMETLAVKALASNLPPFFPPASVRQVPVVMLGGVCLRVTYSGLKWYHDQLIDDRWEPLTVDEFETLLASALHGSTQEINL